VAVENPLSQESKLRRYVELGKRVCVLAAELTNKGQELRQSSTQNATARDQALIGLVIKAYNTFECLLMDAAISRSEAFHHLKTLAETYIYFHWVGIETDDKRAKLLIAKELQCKIELYDANPEFDPEKETRRRFELMIQAWTNGLEREWKIFRDTNLYRVAKATGNNMVGWYNRVYRQACEPAHMSDLSEFMPSDSRPLSLKPQPSLAALKSLMAVNHGLYIILDLLSNVSEMYELGVDDTIAKLKANLEIVRNQPA
jgi:hypothetical protein